MLQYSIHILCFIAMTLGAEHNRPYVKMNSAIWFTVCELHMSAMLGDAPPYCPYLPDCPSLRSSILATLAAYTLLKRKVQAPKVCPGTAVFRNARGVATKIPSETRWASYACNFVIVNGHPAIVICYNCLDCSAVCWMPRASFFSQQNDFTRTCTFLVHAQPLHQERRCARAESKNIERGSACIKSRFTSCN